VVHAVNNVSFTLEEAETMALVGESGCGKSVTMLSLLGLVAAPAGRVVAGEALFFNGVSSRDLLKLSKAEMRQVRGREIGIIFQDPLTSLNPVMTVGEQIGESIITHLGVSKSQARKQTLDLLDYVGIPDPHRRIQAYPHQFSGGMRQRVMIAIAISCMPMMLIADEPTTALDVTVQAQIVELVSRLRKDLHMAVIWITHDLGVVAGMADRVMVMYAGQTAERATVDALYTNPQHPYTIGLLGALPSLTGEDDKRLVSILGTPPDLLEPPAHCLFAYRCPHAFERCWQEVPQVIDVGTRHEVACFYDVGKGGPRDGD
jgi:oligopeptide/dipeptide ABC transporter ATP-binding protein